MREFGFNIADEETHDIASQSCPAFASFPGASGSVNPCVLGRGWSSDGRAEAPVPTHRG